MPFEQLAKLDSALPEPRIMIMQFDPSNAEMTRFGDAYATSKLNLAEARRDAADAARQAAAKGLRLQYLVVRVDSETAFASYKLSD